MNLETVIRRGPTIVRAALHDLRYGGLLGGTVKTRFGDFGAFHSTNTPYEDMARLFASVEVKPEDVLVDIGCGKGRSINWLLGRYPQNRIIGIELDPDICAAVAKRLRRRTNVEIRCGDAIARLPEEGTIFYLFNPFDGVVMARFATALLARRTATIVYYNTEHLDAFRLDKRFTILELDDPKLEHPSAIITLKAPPRPRKKKVPTDAT